MPVALNLDPPEFFGIDLLKPLKDFMNWLVSQLVSFGSSIVNFLSEKVISPVVNALKWVIDKVIEFVNSAISSIINFVKSLAPANPERAFDNVLKLFGVVALGSLSTGIFLTALNVKVVATGLDVSPLTSFLSRLISPQLITGLIIGAILGVGFRRPLEYWANNVFRPNLPDVRTAYSMFVKGIISEETLNYVMRYQGGYSESWISALKKEFRYTPSPFEVMRLADYVSLDPIWISKKLSDVGMEEWDKTKFMEAIIKRPIREEVRSLVYEIGTQYIYGWINEQTCRKLLIQAGVKPEELELVMSRLIWVRKRVLLDQRIDILKQRFRKGLITIEELHSSLLALGLAEENVNLIVEYEKALKGIIKVVEKVELGFERQTTTTVELTYTIE